MKYIEIINATQNNLKHININMPLGKITAISGVSGSGKSSLIYGVLAAEALRKEKNDSGNADLASLCLKADVDEIKNLPYCEVLKQRSLRESVSSSIATISGLHELLRDEFVKNGEIVANSGIVNPPTPTQILTFLKKFRNKADGKLYAQLCENKFESLDSEIILLQKYGVQKVICRHIDKGSTQKTVGDLKRLKGSGYSLLVEIVDLENLESYENLAKAGFVFESNDEKLNFNRDFPELESGVLYAKPTSRLFSFNSTEFGSGRCEYCDGRGYIEDILENNLFTKQPITDSNFMNLPFDIHKGYYKYILLDLKTILKECKTHNINVDKNYFELSQHEQEIIKKILIPKMSKHRGKKAIGVFFHTATCIECGGSRLNYKANAVKLFGKSISEILELNISQALEFLTNKELHHRKIIEILKSLKMATLEYLNLNRTTDTLSGGELQRLKLALILQSKYNNLLYILDEPSVGLHPYNNAKMIRLLEHIVAQNNTIVISEHNEDYLRHSDHTIQLGHGSGKQGGSIIYEGKYQCVESLLKFNRKNIKIDLQNAIYLDGVNFNNIKNENFVIPLNALVVISGISGSGKSSLVKGVLQPLCMQFLESKSINHTIVKQASGLERIKHIANLSQKQVSTNSRSVVATFLDIFDDLRILFSVANGGVDIGCFSFNSKNGQCDECSGRGEIGENLCPVCLGNGFKAEVLEMQLNGLNIAEVLELDMSSLTEFFSANNKFLSLITILQQLGLSHLNFGRRLDSLSGGELQRLALGKELFKNDKKLKQGGTLFIFDEPTRGLDSQNIENLIRIFDNLIALGNSVVAIEHHVGFIKICDFLIDIGPGSGSFGGKNLFSGGIDKLQYCETSITKETLNGGKNIEKLDLPIRNDLKSKIYNFDKTTYPFNSSLLDDKHFFIEKKMANEYRVHCEENVYHFKTQDELFEFVKSLDIKKVFFNPLSQWLYKYKIVPQSIKKQILKKYKNATGDNFLCKVPCDSVELAYKYGLGWLNVELGNGENLTLGTRLVSLKYGILGSRIITPKYFSLYVSGCDYCKGSGNLTIYDTSLFVGDWNKSILEKSFFSIPLKLKIKTAISRFKNEGLFDFEIPFNKLSQECKEIFLYGFKAYKFLKAGGRENALGDYLVWNGLHTLIYENLWQLDNADQVRSSKHRIKCPFCNDGFKKEISFYTIG